MKTLFLIAFPIALVLGGCAADPSDYSERCSSACDRVFKECGWSSFSYQGRKTNDENCVVMCEAVLEKMPTLAEQGLECVESASCSEMSSCEN